VSNADARKYAQRLDAVLDIGTALASARDVDALLQLTVDRVTRLLDAQAATLFMLDEKKNELWSRVLVGSQLQEIRLPATLGLAGHVVASKEGILCADAYSDTRFHPEVDRTSGFRTRSVVAAPLRHVSGRVLGVLEVLHGEVNAFSPEDKALVEAVGAQMASVLDNVLLYEELRHQNEALRKTEGELSHALRELDLLFEVERSMGSAQRQSEVIAQVLEKARIVFGAQAAGVLLMQASAGTLYLRSAAGLQQVLPHPAGRGTVGRVAATGGTVRFQVSGPAADEHDLELGRLCGLPLQSVLCVPFTDGVRSLGALWLANKEKGFSPADERLAELLARQTGRALTLRRDREEGERRTKLAALGQMLSNVVHDFATPMTLISGYSQLLAVEEDSKERARQAEVLEKQIAELNTMMRETLAFARGDSDLLLRHVDVPRFMREVASLLRLEFSHSLVKLHLDVRYDGKVRMDDGKLKRVIFNMAKNAIEAMPDGGNFTITTDREGDDLLLRFDDDGPGIPAEIAGRVFESFVTSGKTGGTGLGLAIVKKVVEEHGGQVGCLSEPGKGAHFVARLPLRNPPEHVGN
jgi:signal transduction histidine kinase